MTSSTKVSLQIACLRQQAAMQYERRLSSAAETYLCRLSAIHSDSINRINVGGIRPHRGERWASTLDWPLPCWDLQELNQGPSQWIRQSISLAIRGRDYRLAGACCQRKFVDGGLAKWWHWRAAELLP